MNNINVKKIYNIPDDRKIILGVASVWSNNKGLDDFIELSKYIDDKYCIVLVGLTKKQIKKLPDNIIGIKKTENIEELVNLYSVAHILFNPSREETFSLVTIEAMACGTPVICYNNSAINEFSKYELCKTLDINDDNKFNKIIKVCEESKKTVENFEKYDINNIGKKYIELYQTDKNK